MDAVVKRRGARWQGPLRRVGMAAQNILEIVRAGRLSAPYGAAFDVVYAEPVYRLRRYRGAVAARPDPGPAILLVPPLMVASEVYDIAPDISAVAALTRDGVDVWLVDFGAPERERGGLERTLDDHVRAVSDAIDRVRAATSRPVHLAGYSQGGMFAYQAAAYRRSEGLASVVTFGSPVNIHRSVSKLSDEITERLVGALHAALAIPLDRIEGLPGILTSTSFKVLSARKEVAQFADFVRKLHDRKALEKRESKRLFLRGGGFVAWPGPALRKFVDEMVVSNRMLTGGFVIDGRTVTLADIRCPILCFYGERDDMARPAAVRAIRTAAPGAEVFEVAVKAGHFGLVVGSSAMSHTWPAVAEWLRWRDGEGPRPEALPPVAEPELLDRDDLELAMQDLQLDLELFYDVITKAAGAAWARLGDAAQDLADSVDHLRYQVPRLSKLRAITADTRISAGLLLAEQAAAIPDKTFFLWRGRAFSYADADRRVDNVVRGMIACGVEPGRRVGVLMAGRPSHLTAVTALSRLGAVSVLLEPNEALGRALEVGQVEVLLADPDNAAAARSAFAGEVLALGGGGGARALPEGVVDMEAINPDAVKLPAWYRPNPGRAGDLAMVILSGGRTGAPRASRITNHRWAFSALGAAATCTLTSRDTVYCCLPLHHAAGSLVAAGSALVGGSRLALASEFSPDTFWTEVRRYGATVVFYAGEMCRTLVDAPYARAENNHPVRLWAGSGMRADVWRRLADRFGPVGVLEFYASTETNAVLANASGEKIGSLGRPMPGSSELALVGYDPDAGAITRDEHGRCERCPPDTPGMLIARLDGAAVPAPPAERVLRDVFEPGDAWYVTGDLLRVDDDGDFWLVDRAVDVIRTAGGWVAARAVEDALYQIPEVAVAAAWGVADAALAGAEDGGAQVAVAAVELRPGARLEPERLQRAVAALPAHGRPRAVRIVEHLAMSHGFRPLKAPLRAVGLGDGDAGLRYDDARGCYVTTEPRAATG